jgi:hypothetical protein
VFEEEENAGGGFKRRVEGESQENKEERRRRIQADGKRKGDDKERDREEVQRNRMEEPISDRMECVDEVEVDLAQIEMFTEE